MNRRQFILPSMPPPVTKPYRPDQSAKLAAIEARRLALNLSVEELASRAGISRNTLHRIRKDQRCWPRTVRALALALRSAEGEQKREAALLGASVNTAKPGKGSGGKRNIGGKKLGATGTGNHHRLRRHLRGGGDEPD